VSHVPALEPRLHEILLAIVHAYRVEVRGRREPLSHVRSGAMKEEVLHAGWPDDGPVVGREDLEALDELGWIRVTELRRSWTFAPTQQAMESVAQYERELTRSQSPVSVDMSWSSVRPVLNAVVDVWERHGASPNASVTVTGVAKELGRTEDDLFVLRAVEMLDESGWVEADYQMGTEGPLSARPLPKALSGARGWPGGGQDAAAERLLAALEELIEREPDEVRRTKLSRVREFMIDLGANTVSEIAAKAAGGAL
jgi:hypothetical protein